MLEKYDLHTDIYFLNDETILIYNLFVRSFINSVMKQVAVLWMGNWIIDSHDLFRNTAVCCSADVAFVKNNYFIAKKSKQYCF